MAVIPLTWNQIEHPIIWNNNPYIWNKVEIEVVQEVEAYINGGISPDVAVNKLNSKKKKILIKLITKVKGEEYIEEKYKNTKNIKISAKDINLLINNVLNIQVKNI